MKYNIGDTVTKKNIKYVIKYLFHTDNITHQAIIIHQLNKLINDSDILLSLRNYIFKNSNKIKQYPNSLDTCGTGGDGLKTLNISTTVAILLSSVGIPIAKHGNRAASSLSGSSDIISELKIPNERHSKKIIKRISNDKFVYLNAPFFYPNLSRVGEVRKKIGIKTIFNYMGPTLNPLGAKFQILGTIDKGSAEIMSKILSKIKNKKFTIFFSEDGLDEISIFAPTNFYFPNSSGNEIFNEKMKKLKESNLNNSNEEVKFGANENGYVYQLDTGNNFDGSNILARFETPNYDYGDLGTLKTLHYLRVSASSEGITEPDVQVRFDYGNTNVPQPTNLFDLGVINPPSKFGDALFNTNVFGGGDNPLIRVPLQGSGTSNNFTIISDDTKPPYTINGFYVDYIPSGRR